MDLNEEKERKQIWIIRWQSGKIRSEYADVPGSEAGSRRDRGRVHHRMSFRKRRQLRYAEELLRILEATLGICAVMMMGTGSLWIGMILLTAGLELSCRYIEKSVKN
ncbi:MAG: hypothetical protein ACLUJR_01595 [Mediterraneibacter gnavus]